MTAAGSEPDRYDALVIGAGISGLYQLYRHRELGLRVRAFEAGSGVGGTWYWNRYPGCRFDSESYSYGYSFSQEVLDEWDWTEHFSPQPETLRYVEFVAEKLDLKRDVTFDTRIVGAVYDADRNEWEITAEDGARARGRYLVTALGPLSVPVMPAIPGVEDFKGPSFHTGLWPHEEVRFVGKRVAVVGTGATGVQLIQEVAKTADSLTVFQRRPNWCAPLHNRPMTPADNDRIRAQYDEIFERCRRSHGAFLHDADPRRALEVSAEERQAFFEKLYGEPGFGIWMGNFRDIFVNEDANRLISDFVANKIRDRVDDPRTAEKLIPKDHGFGTRRVPLETRYFEVYNQPNVRLIDLTETPIDRVTETGIVAGAESLDFDLIVYATGFDAVTGGFDRIDIAGEGGRRLKDAWADGPQTYLGLQVPGFPNMFTLVGPHNAASFCNIPRCIEQNVEWVAEMIGYMEANGLSYAAATPDAAADWNAHIQESSERMLYTKVDSWFNGVNTNIPGKTKRTFLLYAAGVPAYRERCDEVAASGYAGFALR